MFNVGDKVKIGRNGYDLFGGAGFTEGYVIDANNENSVYMVATTPDTEQQRHTKDCLCFYGEELLLDSAA